MRGAFASFLWGGHPLLNPHFGVADVNMVTDLIEDGCGVL
jgi:hypothetical protein